MPESYGLARDNDPEIITAEGLTPVTRTLSDNEYENELIIGLGKKCREIKLADTTDGMIEGLSDLIEIARALAKHISSEAHLEEVRLTELQKRGGFDKRIFLERTE